MTVALGITGASGAIYAKRFLEIAENTHDIDSVYCSVSNPARIVWADELKIDFNDFAASLKKVTVYEPNDFFSPLASGSSFPDVMVVLPCSMSSLARIANGISDNLITRAADVALKERRKLILAVRETPLNLIHIKNMEQVTLAGATVFPLSPAFYGTKAGLNELTDALIGRILKLAGINNSYYLEWGKK